MPLNSLRMMALHEAAHAGTLEQELRTIATQDDGLSRVMRAIAESEPAVLVHCVAGRDRTGLIVALVLAAIGVSDADIVADYVASDAALAAEYARFKAENPDKAAAVDEAIAKRAWVMAETLRTLRTSFGDASRYLAYAGVTAPTIAALHESLTR